MIRKSLGEIIDIKHGYAFDGEHIVSDDNGIVLVTPGNFKIGGGFKEEKCKFFTGEIPENYILNNGDYIVTMTDLSKTIDTLGYSAKIPNNPKRTYLHNQRIGLLNFKDDNVCKDYIYYIMQTNDYQKSIANTSSGATVHHTSPAKIYEYTFQLPKYSIQKKIADFLGSYDALIENNQKQIKLLEEAAQRLYKEWFVDFRFPGYENAKFIDGIPEGWRKEPVCNIVSYEIGGGWGEDYLKEQNDKPAFVIRGTDLHGITHGDILSIPYRYHTQSNLASRILQDGDIVFEVSGGSKTEGVARTLLIRKELLEIYGSQVMCASFCKLIRLVDNSLSQYMYNTLQYLRLSGKTSEFDKKSASSIVNYRWKDFLSQQDVLIPPLTIIEAYNRLAECYYYKIINQSKMIECLKNARDRLLPKLMSGEIEV